VPQLYPAMGKSREVHEQSRGEKTADRSVVFHTLSSSILHSGFHRCTDNSKVLPVILRWCLPSLKRKEEIRNARGTDWSHERLRCDLPLFFDAALVPPSCFRADQFRWRST